jgi:anti-sigma regulatory factor (Ser/Thr protein kinase)
MSRSFEKIGDQVTPWTVDKQNLEDDFAVEVRISSDRATEELHVHQARVIAGKVLRYLGVTKGMRGDAAIIISEFGANAVEHGGGLQDLYLVWTPSATGRPETLDITVINPTEIEDGAPGMENPGGLLAEESNDTSEGGRGMWIAHSLTNGHVDQNPERDSNQRTVMRTHARLGELDEAA